MYTPCSDFHGAQQTIQRTDDLRDTLSDSVDEIATNVAVQLENVNTSQGQLAAAVTETLTTHALAANASLRLMEQQLAGALAQINVTIAAGIAANRPKTGYMQASARTNVV